MSTLRFTITTETEEDQLPNSDDAAAAAQWFLARGRFQMGALMAELAQHIANEEEEIHEARLVAGELSAVRPAQQPRMLQGVSLEAHNGSPIAGALPPHMWPYGRDAKDDQAMQPHGYMDNPFNRDTCRWGVGMDAVCGFPQMHPIHDEQGHANPDSLGPSSPTQ